MATQGNTVSKEEQPQGLREEEVRVYKVHCHLERKDRGTWHDKDAVIRRECDSCMTRTCENEVKDPWGDDLLNTYCGRCAENLRKYGMCKTCRCPLRAYQGACEEMAGVYIL